MYSHTKCQVLEKQGLYKDLEAVTTYKQMGQSYDIGSGQTFEYNQLIFQLVLCQLIHLQLVCIVSSSSVSSKSDSVWSLYLLWLLGKRKERTEEYSTLPLSISVFSASLTKRQGAQWNILLPLCKVFLQDSFDKDMKMTPQNPPPHKLNICNISAVTDPILMKL